MVGHAFRDIERGSLIGFSQETRGKNRSDLQGILAPQIRDYVLKSKRWLLFFYRYPKTRAGATNKVHHHLHLPFSRVTV
jgi:hypothetical protein